MTDKEMHLSHRNSFVSADGRELRSMCDGPAFVVGEIYFVYADGGPDGSLWAEMDVCSPTKPLKFAGEDQQTLGPGVPPKESANTPLRARLLVVGSLY